MKTYKNREDLVVDLQMFNPSITIQKYQLENLDDKSPPEIIEFAFGTNICRAFPHERPKTRYRSWSWYNKSYEIIERLESLANQDDFDSMIMDLGRSLVSEWGSINDDGNPTKMNLGVAMKVVNLIMKHLVYSESNRNEQIKQFQHIPWDKYTLKPLRLLYNQRTVRDKMPSNPSMGFVSDTGRYKLLHNMISEICHAASVPRIDSEFYAWDVNH